ncbi:MAG: hypothetical protein IJ896_10065 [Fibrobacter sp.]|nr:hypothetical protein [Fibrobacter sp.]
MNKRIIFVAAGMVLCSLWGCLLDAGENGNDAQIVGKDSDEDCDEKGCTSGKDKSTTSAKVDDEIHYDCSEYDCVTTKYLNKKMLSAGKYGEFLDTRDNQVYRTVTIGTQTWFAQNLNYNAKSSQCHGEVDANCAEYGRLYYWSSISGSDQPNQGVLQGSCPDGWHVPSDEEFLVLLEYVGGNRTDDIQLELSDWPTYYSYENSATALKSMVYDWEVAGSGDEYGFSSIPSGDRWDYGKYSNLGEQALYWTTTISDVQWGPRALTRRIGNTDNYVNAHWDLLDYMYAIRCLKNKTSSIPASSSSTTQPSLNSEHYDCSVYNCRPTEHLNQDMLAEGKYGELLDTRDNQVYRTTKICNQVWMAQNLNYKPSSGTTYCYDDISSYCTKYGRLYVRAAVSCPAGWHLPNDSEWQQLFKCVGGQSTAADALRASSGWDAHPELNSADKYGFSSLPAGVYYFGDEGNTGWYLSDTDYNDFAVGTGAESAKSTAADYTAISVRCVQD